MTCASKILEGYVAPYTATAVQRLLDEDAVIVGRTNMDEFAMGSSTENSAWQTTRNPLDRSRVPGGSSGGSAAAVAAGFCPVALGSDTGGSVRQPAAFCGIYGLKPTYGAVSRYGLTAFASSFDQIGPLAAAPEDLRLVYEVIAGRDQLDATSAELPPPSPALRVKGLRIGLPREFFPADADPEVLALVRAAAGRLQAQGAGLVEVGLPSLRFAAEAYHMIADAEAGSNLARFDGLRYGFSAGTGPQGGCSRTRTLGFGPEVRRRLMTGTCVLGSGGAAYRKALGVRALLRRDFEAAFAAADFLLGPTAPTAAFGLGEKAADPVAMYLSDVFTIPCSLAGICGASAPAGLTKGGLPAGVQLLGRPFSEQGIFDLLEALKNV